MTTTFQGFPPQTSKFLQQLGRNNNREWFHANKQRYEAEVLTPALSYIEAMRKPLAAISPLLVVLPKRVGGSLMRIHRDTRFAKDKTPYKTNIGIHFRHQAISDVHAPGLYVHIEPKSVFLGVGMWHPEAKSLAGVRQRIAAEPSLWKRARDAKAFASRFTLAGDSLKRPPQGYGAGHPMMEDLKRKDFIGVCELPPEVIERPDFAKQTARNFQAAKPFMQFLCDALDIRW